MCSCGKRLPVTLFEEIKPSTWGYPMWRVLHGLVEKSGRQTNKFLDDDEFYAWKSVLNILHTCLPCNLCRDHYSGFVREHPYDDIIARRGAERREGLRKWLFDLHNQAPMVSDCPRPTIDKLPELYTEPACNVDAEIREVIRVLQLSSQGGLVARNAFDAFRRYITNLHTILRG
jgi:hypothetical protein